MRQLHVLCGKSALCLLVKAAVFSEGSNKRLSGSICDENTPRETDVGSETAMYSSFVLSDSSG